MMNICKFMSFLLLFVMLTNFSYACDPQENEDDIISNPVTVISTNEIYSQSKQLADDIQKIYPSSNFQKLKEKTKYENMLLSLKSDNLSNIHHDLGRLLSQFVNIENPPQELSSSDIQKRIILLKDKIRDRPLNMLQNKCLEHFSSFFPSNFKGIKFEPKTGGRQLGCKPIIHLKNGKKLPYHAKTHGKGTSSKSSHSGTAHSVNPKELFVYKFLEFSNLGHEVHFFYDNAFDFYIATKGTGFNDDAREEFKTYDLISKDFIKYEKKLDQNDEGEVDPIIFKGLVKSDILSRIFNLSDLTSNPDNMGFVFSGDKIQSFKIIDFNVEDSANYNKPDAYKGFLSGNGVHNYSYRSDCVIKYFLFKRDPVKRIKTAKEILQDEKILTSDVIDKAYEFINKFLAKDDLKIPESAITDLKNYVSAVKSNLDLFLQKLQEQSNS